jgi:hypothetical protein
MEIHSPEEYQTEAGQLVTSGRLWWSKASRREVLPVLVPRYGTMESQQLQAPWTLLLVVGLNMFRIYILAVCHKFSMSQVIAEQYANKFSMSQVILATLSILLGF